MSHSEAGRYEEDVEVNFDSPGEEIAAKYDQSSEDKTRHASRELLREETRLVVLDFLASLPPEELTARNLSTSDPKPNVLRKARHRVRNSVSDTEAYERRRVKFLKQSATLRRKLSQNLKRDIENFDQARLRRRESFKYKDVVFNFLATITNNWIDDDLEPYEGEVPEIILYAQSGGDLLDRAQGLVIKEKYKKRPTKLDIIPQHSPGGYCSLSSPVLSPEGKVAAKLEQISQKIMADFPHLMDKPLGTITSGNFSYEQFALAARQVTFDYRDVGWSKVALLCYFAREVAIGGELDDKQLDLLADYSLRFIQESTAEWIDRQGGWAALELEEEIINKDTLISRYKQQEEIDGGSPAKQRSWNSNQRAGSTWNVWMKYGLAALAVGVGVCYSLTRH